MQNIKRTDHVKGRTRQAKDLLGDENNSYKKKLTKITTEYFKDSH